MGGAAAELAGKACWARLFSDDLFGAAGGAPPLELGEGLHDLREQVRVFDELARTSWFSEGAKSAIVGGQSKRCVLSLREKSGEEGWRVDLGPGVYTHCMLQAHGVPWNFPGVARLGEGLGGGGPTPPGSGHGRALRVPPRAPGSEEVWRGRRPFSRMSSYRHFELSFRLRVAQLEDAPLFEFMTTGYSPLGVYLAAENPDAIAVLGLLMHENDSNLVEKAMLKPILTVGLTTWGVNSSMRRNLFLAMETDDYPSSNPQECVGRCRVRARRLAWVVVTLGPDRVVRASLDGRPCMACGPFDTLLQMQRNVDVYLGSHFWASPPSPFARLSALRYRLLGSPDPPLGGRGAAAPAPGVPAAGAPAPGAPRGEGRAQARHGGATRIPRVLHQVWLGPGEPTLLTDSWRAFALFAPGEHQWEHRLWTSEEAIAQAIFGRGDGVLADIRPLYEEETSPAGRSDFLRFALLHTFGGVYVDADALWLGPDGGSLDDLVAGVDFAAAWESPDEVLVATGVLASAPGSAVTARMLEAQAQLFGHCRRDMGRRPWDPLALGTLTHALRSEFVDDPRVRVLPSTVFYPLLHSSNPWEKLGRGLPSFAQRGSISVDLGFSSNKLNAGLFGDAPPAQIGTRRAELVQAWQAAAAHGARLIAGAAEGSGAGGAPAGRGAAAAAGTRFADFVLQDGPDWGGPLAGYPKRLAVVRRSAAQADPEGASVPGGVRQLLVVAHADDESLFGGRLLEDGPPWVVVVATVPRGEEEQRVREAELLAALRESPHVASARLLGLPECSRCAPYHPRLYDELADLLEEQRWVRVVTHGPFGEYGHPQHRDLFLAVRALLEDRGSAASPPPPPLWVFQPRVVEGASGEGRTQDRYIEAHASQKYILRRFRAWSSEACPLPRFNTSLARQTCALGASDVAYYRRTCEEGLAWPGAGGGVGGLAFLRWEALAFALQPLARELAQTADVGFLDAPGLRRLLIGEAAAWASGCACVVGSASALAWRALAPPAWLARPAGAGGRCLRGLPLGTLPGRLLEDVTSPALRGGPMEVGCKPPAATGIEDLAGCSLLLAPLRAALGLLDRPGAAVGTAGAAGRVRGRRWRLAVYGDTDLVSPPDATASSTAGLAVGAAGPPATGRTLTLRLGSALRDRGWRLDTAASRCSFEDGHQRVWDWAPEAREDEPDVNVLAVSRFACWLEVSPAAPASPLAATAAGREVVAAAAGR